MSSTLTNVHESPNVSGGWLRLPVLAKDAAGREALVAAGKRLGIARSYPRALTALARDLGISARSVTGDDGAAALAARLLTLPTHEHVRPSDLRRIGELIGQS